ncbi:carbohydrate ABC transporter substrate-binding protein, CUT1 family [Halobacillus karajensis]|uniref:Multiple sugar-binding protein n=1 Tax=Halobacillus karajensis TaxID=195088 RepID=A0A024P9X8_9BACI|nr:ABC transporter substrate-binding protein [Halobacillus karajensis]CDQ21277.1 Multiple sugar-binding protein precursor [Halobacillus karajensis]CDQ25653.1 Multiple sugar-binding protein precursor [Halobacillus karajensis]CDQ25924.1 Multiple sugar-binding protein precursor [Halobacillus karajensis]SEI10289.1 carbohydrate ABC transporter substrate-binding protein, CUT1 family [Halobacillus karajensis]
MVKRVTAGVKRKLLPISLIGLLLSACQSNSPIEEKPKEEQKITLEIRNPKIEIASPFERMVDAYEQKHPNIEIKVHTVGGAIDDFSDLKAQMAAGKGPDIFTNLGFENTRKWKNLLEDLSDQPWVDEAYQETLEPIKINDKIYGMPMNLEGYGFVYNKDLFDQAGINSLPSTLSELKAAAEKLQRAGITPFATGYYEKWKLGDHLMNIALVRQDNPTAFMKRLNSGKSSIENNPAFRDLLQLLDLTVKYGGDEPLATDYIMEIHTFASGEAAMILQGNWIQPMIDERSPGMDIGLLPIPINNHNQKNPLVVNTPSYWVVNKQTTPSKKREAKKFLNWMVNSKQGQRFMTEELKFVPAFEYIKADKSGPLANDIIKKYKEGRTISSNIIKFPAGVREEFGHATQRYIEHEITREQLLRNYQKTWEQAKKN